MALTPWKASPSGAWDWYNQQQANYAQAQQEYQKVLDARNQLTLQQPSRNAPTQPVLPPLPVAPLAPAGLTQDQELQRQRDLIDIANQNAYNAAVASLTASGTLGAVQNQTARYKAQGAQLPLYNELQKALEAQALAQDVLGQRNAGLSGVGSSYLEPYNKAVADIQAKIDAAAYKPSFNLQYGSQPLASTYDVSKLDKNSPEYANYFQELTFEQAQKAREDALKQEVAKLGGSEARAKDQQNAISSARELTAQKAYNLSEIAQLKSQRDIANKKIEAAKQAGADTTGLQGFAALSPKPKPANTSFQTNFTGVGSSSPLGSGAIQSNRL